MAESSDLLGGRYRLEAPLGAGGMATVHRAHDVLLGRQVAIKFLAANVAASPGHLERFGREARAMAAIVHPNLVAIYDVGWADEQAGQTPYLVMELVPGGTLAERLTAEGPLDPPTVTSLVEGLASALDALHRAGIVHRDVKPQNVLLSPTGPKLADLGIVRVDDLSDPEAAALTASGATPGTLRFLAPEVIFGQAAGPKADAYALAMLAFEALTGRSPRPAVTLGELVHGAWQPPTAVSEAEPSLGTAFDAAFAAGLDLDPSRRLDVQSFAAALWEALTTWLAEHREPEVAPAVDGIADADADAGAGPAAEAEAEEPVAAAAVVAAADDAPAASAGPGEAGEAGEATDPAVQEATDPAVQPPGIDAADQTEPAIPVAIGLSGVARPNPQAFHPGDATTAVGPLGAAEAFRAVEPPSGTSGTSGTSGATRTGTGGPDRDLAEQVSRVLPALAVVALAMGVLVVILLLVRPGGTPGATEPAGSAATTEPSTSLTPGPSDPAAAALAALADVSAAIEAARGGRDGLKGGDANDLTALVDDVRRALQAGDYPAARNAVDKLAERADKVTKDLDDDRREVLFAAIDALRDAIPAG